jgi:hypothetical protein
VGLAHINLAKKDTLNYL